MKRAFLAALLCAVTTFGIFDFVSTLATCQQVQQQKADKRTEESCGFAQSLTFRGWVSATEWIDTRHDFVTATATIVIAFFTFTLWRATDRMWDAGERQLRHLAETSERQLRAYVFPIEAVLTKFSAGEVPECRIVAFNSGQTPAYRLTHVARFVFADFPLKEVLPECRAAEANSMTNLAPKAPLPKLGEAHWLLSEAAEVRLRKGDAAIYLYGRIDFIDAFGRTRWVKYRYITGGNVGFPREGMVGVCAEGNETSEG
jgi:hypothetical protein